MDLNDAVWQPSRDVAGFMAELWLVKFVTIPLSIVVFILSVPLGLVRHAQVAFLDGMSIRGTIEEQIEFAQELVENGPFEYITDISFTIMLFLRYSVFYIITATLLILLYIGVAIIFMPFYCYCKRSN